MSPRFFAIVPAAGQSARMGQPKLLLPIAGRTMIEETLWAWRGSQVDKIVVVARPDDEELAALCRSCGAEVVLPPVAPPEMKDSIRWGLKHVEAMFAPVPQDAWLLAPADMPSLSPRIIKALLAAHEPDRPAILVPTLGGKRGHPVLFPWPLAEKVRELRSDQGVNALRDSCETREVPCDAVEPRGTDAFADIDTPPDYEQYREKA